MIFGHFNAVSKMALLGSWWHPGTLQILFSSPCCQWRSRLINAREDRIICAGDVGTELYFVAVARPKLFLPKKKAGAIWVATTLNSRGFFWNPPKQWCFLFRNTLPWQRMSFLKSRRTNWWSRSEGDSNFLNMSWLTSDKWKMIGAVSPQFLRNLHTSTGAPQENKHSTWEDAIPKGKFSRHLQPIFQVETVHDVYTLCCALFQSMWFFAPS